MRIFPGVGALLLLLVLAAGCSASAGEEHALSGTVVVQDLHVRTVGAPCSGARPFLDVHPSAPVTVRDAEGAVVAEGELGDTEAINAYPELEELERAPTGCQLEFDVTGIPISSAYTVELGERTWSVTFDELEADDWTLEMEIPR